MVRSPELSYIPPSSTIDVLSPATLRAGARNVLESGMPRQGYPGLTASGYPDRRLHMSPEDILEVTSSEEVHQLTGGPLTKIHRIHLPSGHDATSQGRIDYLSNPANVDNLIYPPVPDITTGSDEMVDPKAFQRWLDMGFRVFDQHDRVMPGTLERVIQLLGMRSQGRFGTPLGMPVGNGTFSSPGAHPASDPFIFMRLPDSDGDLATLVAGHPPTEQSHEVWVPPGGFGSKEDVVDGRYSSWQAAVRLCLKKTGFDISEFAHAPVLAEFALSSPTTINAILVPEAHAVEVPYSKDIAVNVSEQIPTGADVHGAQWLSLRALLNLNNTMRREGQASHFNHATQPDHIYWDTHMRGLVAAVNAIRAGKLAAAASPR